MSSSSSPTQGDAIDFRIATAPLATPDRGNWRELIPHRPGIYIISVALYAGHLVRLERANALPSIVIRDLADGSEHVIAFDEAAYSLDIVGRLRVRHHDGCASPTRR